MRIALWNASGLDNIGDRLLDQVARGELARRIPHASFQTFCPWPSGSVPVARVDASGHWEHEGRFDGIVIGGGALLIGPPFIHPSLQTCYLGPDPEAFQDRCPVAWNAVCCDGQFVSLLSERWRGYVRRAAGRLSYLSVRNEHTAEILKSCGARKPVHVVPDPVVLLDPPGGGAAGRRRATGVLVGTSGASSSFLSLLQQEFSPDELNPALRASLPPAVRASEADAQVVSALAGILGAIARPQELEVAGFGAVYGDRTAAELLAGRTGARLVSGRDPLGTDLLEWMASLRCVIAFRLHACILAMVSATPFVAVDPYFNPVSGTSKMHGFMSSAGLEHLHLPLHDLLDGSRDLGDLVECATREASRLPDIRTDLRTAARGHFDALAAHLEG